LQALDPRQPGHAREGAGDHHQVDVAVGQVVSARPRPKQDAEVRSRLPQEVGDRRTDLV
jgi:hypothetical protein